MHCTEFFENPDRANKSELLLHMHEHQLIQWEQQNASSISPGTVEDDETLYHQILDPTNLDDAGTGLSPGSFWAIAKLGMSTNRIKHSTLEDLVQRGQRRAQEHNDRYPNNPRPRKFWGFVSIPVSQVRNVRHEATRALYVFDTATKNNLSHADIFQGAVDNKQTRKIAMQLYELVKGSAMKWPTQSV